MQEIYVTNCNGFSIILMQLYRQIFKLNFGKHGWALVNKLNVIRHKYFSWYCILIVCQKFVLYLHFSNFFNFVWYYSTPFSLKNLYMTKMVSCSTFFLLFGKKVWHFHLFIKLVSVNGTDHNANRNQQQTRIYNFSQTHKIQ